MTTGFDQALQISSSLISLKQCEYDDEDTIQDWKGRFAESHYGGSSGSRLSILHRAVSFLSKQKFDDLFVADQRFSPPLWLERRVKGLSFIQVLMFDYSVSREGNPGYKMSPVFEAAEDISLRAMSELDLSRMGNFFTQSETVMACLRAYFEELKCVINSAQLVADMDSFRRCANANFNSAVSFLGACGRKRSNLLVLRLDLYYRPDVSQSLGDSDADVAVTPKSSVLHRGVFHKELWRRFGEALIGFMWCMEWGKKRKLHFHYLILIDSSKHQLDVLHCRSLGEFWETQATQGLGAYFNVNARAAKARIYSNHAIGKVDLAVPEVQEGLRLIAAYFTLSRYFMKLDATDACRTFGHSKYPTASRGPGRPPKLTAPVIPNGFAKSLRGLAFI